MKHRIDKPDNEQGSSRLYGDAAIGEIVRRCLRLNPDELCDLVELLREHQHEPELRIAPQLRVVGPSGPAPGQPSADLSAGDKPQESLETIRGQPA